MDPARWSDQDMTQLERRLLDAARKDRVPDALGARMAAAIPVGTALSSGTAASKLGEAATSGSTAAGKLGAPLFAKTALWGTLSVGLVAATAAWYATRPAPVQKPTASAPAPLATPQPAVAAQATPEPVPQVATPTLRDPAPVVDHVVPMPASKAVSSAVVTGAKRGTLDDDALRAEVALLTQARQALRERATARALRLLEQHRARFATGALAPEAAALRIEALIQQGSYEQAGAKTEQFVKAYPTHPLRAHVASLLATRADSTGRQ